MSDRPVHMLPGPQGPPGANGTGGGGGGATYVQQFSTPSTTWTVTHPLDTDTPTIEAFDSSKRLIDDLDVLVPDSQTVILSFAVPVAGTAKLST